MNAGYTGQAKDTIAIGTSAGEVSQNSNSVAIGSFAGQFDQGTDAIAIGQKAGQTGQADNTIILNATGSAVNGVVGQTGSFYVAPIRRLSFPTITTVSLAYDPDTFEVVHIPLTTGDTGPTGADGANGANGDPGTNGLDGATGPTGAAGSNGANGDPGTNGLDGATGPTGAAGANGAGGVNGATGPTGTALASGIIAFDELTWTLEPTTSAYWSATATNLSTTITDDLTPLSTSLQMGSLYTPAEVVKASGWRLIAAAPDGATGGNITFFINAGAGGDPNGANGVNINISWGVLGLSAPAPAPP
jgi:hypothetical protein